MIVFALFRSCCFVFVLFSVCDDDNNTRWRARIDCRKENGQKSVLTHMLDQHNAQFGALQLLRVFFWSFAVVKIT